MIKSALLIVVAMVVIITTTNSFAEDQTICSLEIDHNNDSYSILNNYIRQNKHKYIIEL